MSIVLHVLIAIALAAQHAAPASGAHDATEPSSSPVATKHRDDAEYDGPVLLVWGDLNRDGLNDAAAVGLFGDIRLLMNRGGTRFEDTTATSGLPSSVRATCALFLDIDGDALQDLYLGSAQHRLWRNTGNATFEPVLDSIEHDAVDLAARAIDFNVDGRVDLHIHTEIGDLLYAGNGNGTFSRTALPIRSHGTSQQDESVLASEDVAPPSTPAQLSVRRWTQQRADSMALSQPPTASAAGEPIASGTAHRLAATALPSGIISMWAGPIAGVPAGWALCDGTNGTPDLRDRFVLGVTTGENPGATGGASSHTHTTPNHQHSIPNLTVPSHNMTVPTHSGTAASHSTNTASQNVSLPTHTHTVPAQNVTTSNSSSNNNVLSSSTSQVATSSHTHSVNIPSSTTSSTGPTSISIPSVNVNIPSTSVSIPSFSMTIPSVTINNFLIDTPPSEGAGQTNSTSHTPPYYKLAFIQKL